jgi:ABC-type transport system involved in multi-copper enzyme maturation permease subunit
MVLSKSPEALFSAAVLGIVVLIRRDWSKQLVAIAIPAILGVVLVIAFAGGFTYIGQVLRGEPSTGEQREPILYRIEQITVAMTSIRPLGDGYSVTEFREGIVHNVPLIIVQQLGYPGILAGLAWLWVVGYGLIRTKWKYVWVLVFSLSVWDHYVWTQLAPWFWAIAGVTSAQGQESDLIFRRAR